MLLMIIPEKYPAISDAVALRLLNLLSPVQQENINRIRPL
jgi:hypothetical protein